MKFLLKAARKLFTDSIAETTNNYQMTQRCLGAVYRMCQIRLNVELHADFRTATGEHVPMY